jgi:hypothetical protein
MAPGQIAGTQARRIEAGARQPAAQVRERIVDRAGGQLLKILDHHEAPGATQHACGFDDGVNGSRGRGQYAVYGHGVEAAVIPAEAVHVAASKLAVT